MCHSNRPSPRDAAHIRNLHKQDTYKQENAPDQTDNTRSVDHYQS